jgi:hypothetical protein
LLSGVTSAAAIFTAFPQFGMNPANLFAAGADFAMALCAAEQNDVTAGEDATMPPSAMRPGLAVPRQQAASDLLDALSPRLVLPVRGRRAPEERRRSDDGASPIVFEEPPMPVEGRILPLRLAIPTEEPIPSRAARNDVRPIGVEPDVRPEPETAAPADRTPAETAIALRVAPKPAASIAAPKPLTVAPAREVHEEAETVVPPAAIHRAHPYGFGAGVFASAPSAPAAATMRSEEAPEAAEAAPVLLKERPTRLEPLREISFDIQQPNAERVEIRLQQRSGELHLAVRASDSQLAHAMREGLPQLATRIEQDGHRVEAWRPGGLVNLAGIGEADRRPGSAEFPQPDSQEQQRWAQHDGDRRNPHQRPTPQWVEDLEGALAGETGESNGFRN